MDDNIQKIEKIDLFPFYKAFFSDDGTWETLAASAKLPHSFMLFRLLSIKHPEYMSCINAVRSVFAIDALHNEFKTKGRQPGWAYTKSEKEIKPINESLKKYPEELLRNFMRFHELERKSFEFLLEYDNAAVFKELDEELKIYNQSVKKK